MPLQGSCACKTVTYEVDGTSWRHFALPLRTCRKTHAAAFNSAAGVQPEAFRWLSGEAQLSQFESSPGKVRYFCSQCGSHLLARRAGRPMWVLRIAAFG